MSRDFVPHHFCSPLSRSGKGLRDARPQSQFPAESLLVENKGHRRIIRIDASSARGQICTPHCVQDAKSAVTLRVVARTLPRENKNLSP